MNLLNQEEQQQDRNVVRCPQCGKVVNYGRVDRRFCSITCKNLYHNRTRYAPRLQSVDRVLRFIYFNRDVLDKLIKMGVSSIDRSALLHMGYNMNYFTSVERLRGRWLCTCLDIGYELTSTRIRNIRYLCGELDASPDRFVSPPSKLLNEP